MIEYIYIVFTEFGEVLRCANEGIADQFISFDNDSVIRFSARTKPEIWNGAKWVEIPVV